MRPRLLLLPLALWLSGCAPEPEPVLHDIVLVTVDTLRADHLGCYGYHRDTSPTLDALAAEGVLFERAISPIATTLPAHLSLMTGIYPHQHGYLTNRDAVESMFVPTPGRLPAAEVLRAAGYATGAFVSGPTVTRATGIQSGFDRFDQHEISHPEDIFDHSRRADETIQLALEWLAEQGDQPTFLWIHLWDPHEPNVPQEPWASMFSTDDELRRLIEEREIDPALLRERFNDLELARLFAPEVIAAIYEQRDYALPPIDDAAVCDMLNRYDGDVRYVDDQLARLFDGLRAEGRWDDSIVAITSDHGQALGQHDWLEHGRIQLENTHVPLVMRLPTAVSEDEEIDQPARLPRVASLIDVFPTILARMSSPGFRAFLNQAEGVDLLSDRFDRPWAFSERSGRVRDWEPEPGHNGRKIGLTLDDWRYYYRPEDGDELYDLRSDPGELTDVHQDQPDLVRRLREVALEVLARGVHVPGESTRSPQSQELLELLKKNGYVGD